MAENKKLIQVLKKHPEESESFYSEAIGVERTKIGPLIWFNEPLADPSLKFKGNKANIVKARKDGIRWERIAARTGLSVAEAKEVGGKEAANIYTGRGRPVGSYKPDSKPKAASGRRQSNKGTSGRRQSAAKGGKGGKGRPRARTRAERLAKSGDPK